MKRKVNSHRGPHVSQHELKAKIVQKVREGVFDRNPLLATPHTVECKACGCLQKIIYLKYLRSRRFELGKTKTIEVAYAAPTLLGLRYTRESMTPILIKIRCERCGTKISCCPASLEYLMFTARRQVRSEQVYIE